MKTFFSPVLMVLCLFLVCQVNDARFRGKFNSKPWRNSTLSPRSSPGQHTKGVETRAALPSSTAVETPDALIFQASQALQTTIIQPVVSAVKILAVETLKPLADAPVPANASLAKPIILNLHSGVAKLVSVLSPVSNASDAVQRKLAAAEQALTVVISSVASQIKTAEAGLAARNAQIAAAAKQVAAAESQLAQLEGSRAKAEAELRKSEDRVNNARNCIWHRRKRGLLGKIKNAVKKVVSAPVNVVKKVVNAPCYIVNDIKERKSDRDLATTNRDHAVANLDSLRKLHQSYVTGRDNMQRDRATALAAKTGLETEAQNLRKQQQANVAFGVAARAILTQAGVFSGQTAVLQDIIAKLGNMADLTKPLSEVVDSVEKLTHSTGAAELRVNVKSIGESLVVIKKKLPLYPAFAIDFETGEVLDLGSGGNELLNSVIGGESF